MIQLKRSKNGSYELFDKKLTVLLTDREVQLGNYRISSPGEYEQNGVEVVYAINAALIVWDHLQIAYVFNADKPDSFEKNQFSSTDVLLLSENTGQISKDQLSVLTDVYDPRAVVFGSKTPIDDSYKATLKAVEQSPVKLAAQTLPVEGRDYIVLP
jgi:hypothetical protein